MIGQGPWVHLRAVAGSLCTPSVLLLACSAGSSTPQPAEATAAAPAGAVAEATAEPAAEPVGESADANAPHEGDLPTEEPAAVEPTPAPLPKAPDGTIGVACPGSPERMSCIPAGPFMRGRDDGERSNEKGAATVWLQTYFMDQYEVTYAEYKACQKAKNCPRSGPQYTDFNHPDMPIQGVSWFDAMAYCEAQGKTLPTEAQWEKAARGPDGELHPWGNAPATCELAIIKDAQGRSCGLKKAISKPETGRPWDVGSRPVGRYGLYDMIGNSWEWVADWYTRSYEVCGEDCVGVDPRGPCEGGADVCRGHSQKIVRGGSWYWDAAHGTGTYRRAHFPANAPHFHHFGFRCAATLEQVAAMSNSAPEQPAP